MTQPLLAEYFPILVFLAIAGGIAVAMVGGSLLVARQKPNAEKLSAYECGFEPFDDTRRRFDVRFYLVAILFIIFDLEVAFLFPGRWRWAISAGSASFPWSASSPSSRSASFTSGAKAPWIGSSSR
jgi:NADH-quinone oxidoreductase subunit A